MLLLQYFLVFIVTDFADVEKQLGSDVFIRSLEFCEFFKSVALRLEVVDKGAEQKGQARDIFALLRLDQFLVDLLRRTFVQLVPMCDEQLS